MNRLHPYMLSYIALLAEVSSNTMRKSHAGTDGFPCCLLDLFSPVGWEGHVIDLDPGRSVPVH